MSYHINIFGENMSQDQFTSTEDVQYVDFDKYVSSAYLDYAMSVVCGRAIPFIQDGQKPVQRRILYAMQDLRLFHDTKAVKSARIVGHVLGLYHPHGDKSVYDAAVRQSQPFMMRYPLVHGEGNFGSRDGDEPAAMRYTEAKMSHVSTLLLKDIGHETVDFTATYDGTGTEPHVLPARLPFILMNGADGIAVGMSTVIPSHNAREICDAVMAYMKDPKITFSEIMQHIHGPDLATGGKILMDEDKKRELYLTGNGVYKVQGSYEILKGARNSWKLVINELPYGVSSKTIMEELSELMSPTPKEKAGKKEFTEQQNSMKQIFSSLIETFSDNSDIKTPICITIEPKTSKVDPDMLVSALLSYTSFQVTNRFNLVMIRRNGKPGKLGIMDIIEEWSGFRFEITRKRFEFFRKNDLSRLHIVDGRIIAYDNLDAVIKIIQNSKNPKEELCSSLGFSEIQAEDILNIRLRQLANLEKDAMLKENKKLNQQIARYTKILEKHSLLVQEVVNEINEDLALLGDDPRRSIILHESEAKQVDVSSLNKKQQEVATLAVSSSLWARYKAGSETDPGAFQFKTGDSTSRIYQTTTSGQIIGISNKGKTYSCEVSKVASGRQEATPLMSVWDISENGERLRYAFCQTHPYYVLINTSGFGFIAEGQDLVTKIKAGKKIMTMNDGEDILEPIGIDAIENNFLYIANSNGYMTGFKLSELPVNKSRSKGVGLMKIEEGSLISHAMVLPKSENMAMNLVVDGKQVTLAHDKVKKMTGPRNASKKGTKIGANFEFV